MKSLADDLPPELAALVHPDWRANGAAYGKCGTNSWINTRTSGLDLPAVLWLLTAIVPSSDPRRHGYRFASLLQLCWSRI